MKQVTVTLGYRQQKCKAKWVKAMQEWQIYCPEHKAYYVHVGYNGPTTPPHDVAMIHISREHTGE